MDRGPTFGCFFGHGRLEGGQILWNLRKIKFSIEYDDKWIALLLGFEINSMIHFMKWTIHLHWQDVFIPMWIFSFVLFSKINALQCIIYLRCIYHIYFAEEKKWRSLFILLFCGLHTPSIKWPSDIFNDHNGIGNCLQKIEFGDFLGEGIVLSLSVSYFYESGKAKNFVKWTHLFVFLCCVWILLIHLSWKLYFSLFFAFCFFFCFLLPFSCHCLHISSNSTAALSIVLWEGVLCTF